MTGTLSDILASVTKVTGIVGEIAASVREQANGIAGLDTAVGEMDRVTQQNAAAPRRRRRRSPSSPVRRRS